MSKHLLPATARAFRQRGGITILVALILLGVMSLAAFAMAKNSLREISVTGNVWQATKAAEAADAGLDWFVVWTHPANADAATTAQRKALLAGMRSIEDETDVPPADKPWDRSITLASADGDVSDDFVFDNARAQVSQSASAGNATTQAFDLTVRYLGEEPAALTTGTTVFDGGKGGKKPARDLKWQATGDGRASINAGAGMNLRYRAVRELVTTASRTQ
jgi:Tfp pilus assembly protein PilX